MAWGANKLGEFQQKSRKFSRACAAAGHRAKSFVLDKLNHFQFPHKIVSPKYPIFANILKNTPS
jgi:hypothetical protein